jgi:hypothetical protein
MIADNTVLRVQQRARPSRFSADADGATETASLDATVSKQRDDDGTAAAGNYDAEPSRADVADVMNTDDVELSPAIEMDGRVADKLARNRASAKKY